MIGESIWRRSKQKRIRFLIDSSQKKFDEAVAAKSFSLEEIGREVVKIKSIPICFRWASNGDTEEVQPEAGKAGVKPCIPVVKGPNHQRPWFRPLSKVRIVPGILGRRPEDETRVKHLADGEREVRARAVSSHRLPLPPR